MLSSISNDYKLHFHKMLHLVGDDGGVRGITQHVRCMRPFFRSTASQVHRSKTRSIISTVSTREWRICIKNPVFKYAKPCKQYPTIDLIYGSRLSVVALFAPLLPCEIFTVGAIFPKITHHLPSLYLIYCQS